MYLDALETVTVENRGRKKDSIEDVVVWMAAMVMVDDQVIAVKLCVKLSSVI